MKKITKWLFFIGLFLLNSAAATSGRFKDNGNGTLTDTQTKLMWQQDGSSAGKKNWEHAKEYCKNLRLAKYSDWRLPSKTEWLKLIHKGREYQHQWLNNNGFKNIRGFSFWSSSTDAHYSDTAWRVCMVSGLAYSGNKKNRYYILAVRVS